MFTFLKFICSIYLNFLMLLLQRNYRFFFMFVSSTTLLCAYVHIFCWVYIKRIMNSDDTTIWKAMIKTPASICLIVYTFIAVWFVGGLTAFHLYLISTNQVTVDLPCEHEILFGLWIYLYGVSVKKEMVQFIFL